MRDSQYEHPEYISMAEAARYCPYSQEYLSLRARQGKLKALKIGRNWATKHEWLEEYIRRVEGCRQNGGAQKKIEPPSNLPVQSDTSTNERRKSKHAFPSVLSRVGVVVAVLLVLTTGVAYGKGGIAPLYRDAAHSLRRVSLMAQEEVERLTLALQHVSSSIEQDLRQTAVKSSAVAARTRNTLHQTSQYFSEGFLAAKSSASFLSAQTSAAFQPISFSIKEDLRQTAVKSSAVAARTRNTLHQTSQYFSEGILAARGMAFSMSAQASSFSRPYFSWIQETLSSVPSRVTESLTSLNQSLESSLARDARMIADTVTISIKVPLALLTNKDPASNPGTSEEDGLQQPLTDIRPEPQSSGETEPQDTPLREPSEPSKDPTPPKEEEQPPAPQRQLAPSSVPLGRIVSLESRVVSLNKDIQTLQDDLKDVRSLKLAPGPQGPKGEKGDPGITTTIVQYAEASFASVSSPSVTTLGGSFDTLSVGYGSLTVDSAGNLTTSSSIQAKNLSISQDTTLTGDLTISGSATVGSSSTDTLTLNASPTFQTDIAWAAATPSLSIPDTETLSVTDGTNTLFTLQDNGTAATLTVDTVTPTTINAFTAGGNIDLNTNTISNIGASGTDFTPTGGLTLADTLTVSSGGAAVTGDTTLEGNLLFGTDNTTDIGASGASRPRTGYFGTSVVVGDTVSIDTDSITASGALTLASTSGAFTLNATGQTVDVDSGALDIDSSGNITVDASGTSTMSFATANGTITFDTSAGNNNIALNAGTGDLVITTDTISSTSTTALNLGSATVDFDGAGTLRYADGSDFAIQDSGNNTVFKLTGSSDLIEIGNATDNNNVTFLGTGTTSVSGSLDVTGEALLRDEFTLMGAATLGSSLDVGGDFNTDGTANIGSTLDVTGNTTLAGDLLVSGNLTITGLTTSNGSVDLGDTAADTITFVGVVDSNIVPETTNTHNLGSASKVWATGYFTNVNAGNIEGTLTSGNTEAATWLVNSDNATANAEIASLAFSVGTDPINAVLQWSASGDAGRVAGYDDTFVFNYPISLFSEVSGGNQTFTSGSLLNYGQNATHAITQSGALTGLDLDFSSNITVPDSASGNQTGILITLKDGGASAASTGFSLAGTADYGLDLSSAAIGTADIRYADASDFAIQDSGSNNIFKLTGSSNLIEIGNATDNNNVTILGTGTVTIAGDLAAATMSGDLDLDSNIITNIGNTGTDFTATGALTLADALTVSANGADVTGDLTLAGNLDLSGAARTVTLEASTANALDIASGLMSFDTDSSRVGIGTTSPSTLLEVSGSSNEKIRITSTGTGLGSANTIGALEFYGNDASAPGSGVKAEIRAVTVAALGDDAALDFYVSDGTTNNNFAMRLDESGNLGIGTTSPSSLLDLETAGTAKANLDILTITNTVNAADMDGTETSLLFNQWYYDAETPAVADAARITTGTEQDWTSTASTQDAYLAFETALNGTVTEYVRIDSAGQVGIGTTSPSSLLHVDGAAQTVTSAFSRATIDNTNAITTNTGSTAVYSLQIDEPNITTGTQQVTNAASLYVTGAPTEASTGNYALWVDDGATRLDGSLGFSVTPANYRMIHIGGSFTSGGGDTTAELLSNVGTLTGASGDTTFLAGSRFASAIATQTAAESITDIAQVMIQEPDITDNLTGNITNATTLKIVSAPTEGQSNYALWVDAGTSRFDGTALAENASGWALVNEAASDSNPTLIPDRSDLTTGIGASSDLRLVVGGSTRLRATTSAIQLQNVSSGLDMNGNVLGNVGGTGPTSNNTGIGLANNAFLVSRTVASGAGLNLIGINSSDTLIIGNTTISTATLKNATLQLDADTSTLDFSSATGVKTIQTGGSTDLAIMPGGLVGIGTTSPSSLLHVDGAAQTVTSAFSRAIIDNTNAITTNTGSTAVYSLQIDEPNITTGTQQVTNAASLYVTGAPTEASTGNYALWVDDGISRLDGNLVFGLATNNLTIAATDQATGSRTATIPDLGSTDSTFAFLQQAQTWTADQTFNDSVNLTFGTGGDADIYYDGTDLVIDPQVVGTGDVLFNANDSWIKMADSAGTGSINLIKANASDQVQLGAGLMVDGALIFPDDAGLVTAMDLPLTSSGSAGDDNAYYFAIGQDNIARVFGENNGSGTLQNGSFQIIDGTAANPSFSFISDPDTGIFRATTDELAFATGGTEHIRIDSTGLVGIGTTIPRRLVDILHASDPQLRLTQTDNSIYSEFQVAATTGDLTLSVTGDDITFNQPGGSTGANLFVCEGDACPSVTLSDGGNVIVEGSVHVDDSGAGHGEYKKICPTGYVWVSGSAKFGTLPGFCVMKYEAKDDGVGNAVSQASGTPWVSISQETARAECQALGTGYHLVSEPEWMTIAEDVSNTAINDTDDTAGLQIATGHTDSLDFGNTANAIASIDAADPVVSGCTLTANMEDASNAYSAGSCEIRGTGADGSQDADEKGYYDTGDVWATTGYSSGAEGKAQLRTHVLSNGNVIWDIAGNVWEWTDRISVAGEHPEEIGSVASEWLEYNTAAGIDFKGFSYLRPPDDGWDSANGIGKIYTDIGDTASASRAFLRGGYWNNGSSAGVFALYLSIAPTSTSSNIGFRCAR